MWGNSSESNTTASTDPGAKSVVGLAVGLPVFFLVLLLAGIAAVLWLRRRKSVDVDVSNKLKGEDNTQAQNSRESPYSGYAGGQQPTSQSPIYENFQRGQSASCELQGSAIQSQDVQRAPDVYLECDANEAIYSNDPALYQENTEYSEDLYIMPDA